MNRPQSLLRFNLTAKLLVYLVVAGVLPLLLLGGAAFELSRNIVIEQAETEESRQLASLSSYLRLYHDQIEDLAANIAGNAAIGLALRRADEARSDTFDALETRAQMGYLLNSYMRVKGLVSINLFSREGERFQVGETLNVSQVDRSLVTLLMKEARQANLPVFWRGINDNLNTQSEQKKVARVVRLIQHFSPLTGQSDAVGVLVIDLNNNIMRSFLEGVTLAPGAQLMAIDRLGSVVLHSNAQMFGEPLAPALLALVRASPPVPQFTLNGVPMLMSVAKMEQPPSLLVALTPRQVLTDRVNRLASVTFGLLILALLAILALTWYFARTVVLPIRAVSAGFRQLASRPDVAPAPLQVIPAHEEITQLVQGYADHLAAVQAQRADAQVLREAKTIAEAANLSKSRFLATMSHEIRTPMNGIMGMAQLLIAAQLSDAERIDYAQTVLSSGQSLLHLLNDILDLSKIEAGKVDLDPIVFNPAQLLVESQRLFEGAARSRKLRMNVRWLGPTGQRYRADAHRIGQMLHNLVDNALKFTPQGQVWIEATEHWREDGQAILEFSVSDTGIGIGPGQLAQLFKPFVQADSSTTRHYGGSGLGLSIVARLAQLLGGEADAQSTPGKGSRFWFRVRAALIDPADPQAPPSGAGAPNLWAPQAPPPGDGGRGVDASRMEALLTQIYPLLSRHKYDALERFGELQQLLRGTELEASMNEIGQLVRALRFEDALTHLRQWDASRTKHDGN